VKFCRLTPFLDSPLTVFQLFPILFISSSIMLLPVLLGHPLLLTPWGLQSNASRVRSLFGSHKVCPIHPHFLSLICISAGRHFALSHNNRGGGTLFSVQLFSLQKRDLLKNTVDFIYSFLVYCMVL
jgi:hypothetical protein